MPPKADSRRMQCSTKLRQSRRLVNWSQKWSTCVNSSKMRWHCSRLDAHLRRKAVSLRITFKNSSILEGRDLGKNGVRLGAFPRARTIRDHTRRLGGSFRTSSSASRSAVTNLWKVWGPTSLLNTSSRSITTCMIVWSTSTPRTANSKVSRLVNVPQRVVIQPSLGTIHS